MLLAAIQGALVRLGLGDARRMRMNLVTKHMAQDRQSNLRSTHHGSGKRQKNNNEELGYPDPYLLTIESRRTIDTAKHR
jgi:hypothetical protein